MSKIVLIGGGGHCKSVLDTIIGDNIFSRIVITDPSIPTGSEFFGCKVAGSDNELERLYSEGYHNAFLTVGCVRDASLRRMLYEKALRIGYSFPSIIDASANVSAHAQIGDGIYIGKNAVINADAKVMDQAIINTGAIIEHDCQIGEFSHIAVGTVVCGEAVVGRDCMIGANATVLQGVSIGDRTTVGAGAVVTRNLDANCMAYGVPARIRIE